MTVGQKVKTAISSLKSAQASFESFALETQNQTAKQMWTSAANQTKQIVDMVNSRVQELEQEEPQYNGY